MVDSSGLVSPSIIRPAILVNSTCMRKTILMVWIPFSDYTRAIMTLRCEKQTSRPLVKLWHKKVCYRSALRPCRTVQSIRSARTPNGMMAGRKKTFAVHDDVLRGDIPATESEKRLGLHSIGSIPVSNSLAVHELQALHTSNLIRCYC